MLRYKEKQQIIEGIIAQDTGLEQLTAPALQKALAYHVARLYEGSKISLSQKKAICHQLFHTMRGFDILQPLLEQGDVTEIMVNGPDRIFIERHGRLRPLNLSFDDREHLIQVISRCFGRANKVINELKPICSMRLPDGSRIHAVLPPAAPNGPALSIRRFTGIRPQMGELIAAGSLSSKLAQQLAAYVQAKRNIFISGGTGTGKTTFLNALSAFIPAHERVITIEDTAELQLQGLTNLLRLEAREGSSSGEGQVSLQALIRASLRLRPDRIIVGEVRGEEAFDMVEAMSTGHPGSMSTGHGNSANAMLERLCLLIQRSSNLPWEAIKRMLANSIEIVIHLERLNNGQRSLHSVLQLEGLAGNHFRLGKIYQRKGTEHESS